MASKFIFYFKIMLFLDDEVDPHYLQSGFGLADSFSDATKQLEEYYGTDLYKILHLELLSDSPFFFMPDEMCHLCIAKDEEFNAPVLCDEAGRIKEVK